MVPSRDDGCDKSGVDGGCINRAPTMGVVNAARTMGLLFEILGILLLDLLHGIGGLEQVIGEFYLPLIGETEALIVWIKDGS